MREHYVVNPKRWFEYCALVISPVVMEMARRTTPGMKWVKGEHEGGKGGGM